MILTFQKFFKEYANYHSFIDLLNFCKEVADYVYNNQITKSNFFDEFKETDKGYEIIFNRSGKKNYFVDAKKEKVKDGKGDDQLIDNVYQDIETLYNIIKNYEIEINIKQIDEEVKTFNQIIPDELSVNKGIKELENKIGNNFVSLKRGILDLIDKKFNGDETKVQNFMNTYVDPNSDEILEGLIEDADIFDFYLKMQSDVDQILLDNNYYDDPPEVESLYDYVIDGTFDAVVYCMEEMLKEMFE